MQNWEKKCLNCKMPTLIQVKGGINSEKRTSLQCKPTILRKKWIMRCKLAILKKVNYETNLQFWEKKNRILRCKLAILRKTSKLWDVNLQTFNCKHKSQNCEKKSWNDLFYLYSVAEICFHSMSHKDAWLQKIRNIWIMSHTSHFYHNIILYFCPFGAW